MTDRISVTCYNPQQAHTALTSTIWPQLKAMCTDIPGIYQITCLENGRFYIGSSNKLRQRLLRHCLMLEKKKHENRILQNSFNKYGRLAFSFEILELCPVVKLFEIEQKWIDKNTDSGLLFNINKIASRPPSFNELDPEIREIKRQKHRVSATGRKISEKHKAVLASRVGVNNPNFGKSWNDPDRVERARKRMLGAGSPTFGLKGPNCPIFGIKRSAETRKKMSENSAQKGKLGALHHASIPCFRKTIDGVIHSYEGLNQASRDVGFSCSTIVKWCKGKRKPRDGSIWSYA